MDDHGGPTLGRVVRRLRRQRGWSQHDLARAAGVRQPLVSRIESGVQEDATFSTVVRLADALEVSVDELADRQPPPTDPLAQARRLARLVLGDLDDKRDETRGSAPPDTFKTAKTASTNQPSAWAAA